MAAEKSWVYEPGKVYRAQVLRTVEVSEITINFEDRTLNAGSPVFEAGQEAEGVFWPFCLFQREPSEIVLGVTSQAGQHVFIFPGDSVALKEVPVEEATEKES